jgi:hypothetical protein
VKSKEEILALLIELGSTADEVATKLVSLKIKGHRYKCKTCPLAQYLIKNGVDYLERLYKLWGGIEGIAVESSGEDAYLYSLDAYPKLTGVHNFISSFDFGEYPQCETEPK